VVRTKRLERHGGVLYAWRFGPSKEGKVDLHAAGATDARFRAYASEVASVLGHADRVKPFEDYCIGLISAEGRKSVEPLAAVTAPERTAAQHQFSAASGGAGAAKSPSSMPTWLVIAASSGWMTSGHWSGLGDSGTF
jgi:hypothetical protein